MTDLVLAAGRLLPGLPGDRRARAAAAGGVTVDAGGAYVFRHEPSGDPARLQMFHQREIVRHRRARRRSPPGATPGATARSRSCAALGLDADSRRRRRPVLRPQRPDARRQPARAGAQVRDPRPRSPAPEPTAVASFNYHQDHFAATYGHRAGRRRRRPHRLPRLRARADHARAVPHPRARRRRAGPTRSGAELWP